MFVRKKGKLATIVRSKSILHDVVNREFQLDSASKLPQKFNERRSQVKQIDEQGTNSCSDVYTCNKKTNP
jgi:hypothetical protein